MNLKTLFALIASFGIAASTAQVAYAAECVKAKDYNVKKPVTFARTSVSEAFRKIVSDTPFVALGSTASKKKIGAEQITGNLAAILDEITAHAGMKWSQDGCTIRYSDKVANAQEKPAAAVSDAAAEPTVEKSFVVAKGESLHTVLDRWAKVEGWSVSWDIDEFEVIELGEGASFDGPMKKAVADLVSAMAQAGEKLDVTYHNGNKVIRVARYAN